MKQCGKVRGKLMRRLLATMLAVALVVGLMPAERVKAETYAKVENFYWFPQKAQYDCGISSVSMIECWGLLKAGKIDKSDNKNDMFDAVYEKVFAANDYSNTIGNSILKHFRNIKGSNTSITLKNIHDELKEGHPVLIHRKNNIHWSVVVRYEGSSSKLEESGFIVYNTTIGGSVDEPTTDKSIDTFNGERNLASWKKGKDFENLNKTYDLNDCLDYVRAWDSLVTEGYPKKVPSLMIEGLAVPTNMKVGGCRATTGLVISNGKITKIKAWVEKQGVVKGTVCEATPMTKYFSFVNFDNQMTGVLDSLGKGTYTYFVEVDDTIGDKIRWKQDFPVTDAETVNAHIPVYAEQTGNTNTDPYPNILLHVPYYPQRSSTVDDCGISSIAMIEGYARGYDKTKFTEMYNLVFQTNGNQYPPKDAVNWSRYLEASNVLGEEFDLSKDMSILYKCLQNGKPILIHRIDPNNEDVDHWSVIVGYNGSTTNLEVSGFLVWNTMSGVAELNYDEVLPVSANKKVKRGVDLQTWLNKTSTTKLANVKVRYLGISDLPKTGSLDLNGCLDGTISGSISGFGTADVWINEDGQWVKKAEDCADYYAEWPEGTKYRINDIKALSGKQYNGVHQGALEGMITGDGTVSVVLNFTTQKQYLDLNGFLDGTVSGSLEGYGTADVWIYEDGQYVRVADDCGDYCTAWPVGTKYRIDDIKPFAGKKYNGVHQGTLEGTLAAGNDTCVYLDFSTVSVSVSTNLLELDLNTNPTGQVTLDYSNCPGTYYIYHDYDGNSLNLKVDSGNQKQIYTFTALKAGTQTVTIRVANQANVELTRTTFQVNVVDTVKPEISEVWVSDLDNTGYTVNCRASDKAGIWYVAFPTWTDYNGQDDLAAVWPSVSVPVDGVYSYRVNIADHNNETGAYITHIYVYDDAGNANCDGIGTIVPKENVLHFDSDAVTVNEGEHTDGHYWFTGDGIKSIACDVEDPSVCRVEMYEPTWALDPPDGYMTIYGLKAGTTKVTLSFVNEQNEKFYQKSFRVNVATKYYVVSFDANGGSGSMDAVSVEKGSAYELPVCGFTAPAGKTFDGWDVNGTMMQPGQKITVTKDVTVKAMWKSAEEHDAIVITKQPKNVTATKGASTTFSVTATGEGLTYLWQYELKGSTEWVDWTSKKTATISVAYLKTRDGMKLRCVITDKGGSSVTSDEATLTYGTPVAALAITKQPESIKATKGASAPFSVTAIGEGLTYLWQYKLAGSTEWVDWTSKKTATISVAYLKTRDGMKLRCVVTDKSGNSLTSNEATLTYGTPVAALAITKQPESINVAKGASAPFSVTAIGEGLTYLWQYKLKGSTEWVDWTSKKTAEISVAYLKTRDGMKLRCVIADKGGNSVTSDEATLTYGTPAAALAITKQPESINVAKGASASFSVTATGEELTYLWQYKLAGSTEWVDWTSKKTAAISVAYLKTRDGMKLRCVIADKGGNSVTSDEATLTYGTPAAALAITKQPESINVAKGASASFSVTALGEELTYLWQYKLAGSTEWVDWTSKKTAAISVAYLKTRDGMKLRCVIADKGGNSVTSDEATLTY